ncbi:hypothetical protein N7466_011211 [Penicillium verhagenii]|uniref:uncharacterized protein n=1 Tax=Penicillium verhagenii TaxID=1562060 RepID=UPI002545107A|nr:uncharacterized protein N7466_011211 [Penicillium verhagenii]KAJ5917657.1 hypothetical protein N7466_011211 [Penicillium verhagenii]
MNRIALRAQRGSRSQGAVCQFCQFSTATPRRLPFARLPTTTQSRLSNNKSALQLPSYTRSPLSYPLINSRTFASESIDTGSAIQKIEQDASALHNSDQVPSNEAVIQLLERCQHLTESLVSQEHETSEGSSSEDGNATSSLLDMQEKSARPAQQVQSINLDPRQADAIARITTDLLKDEKVFITPEALESYTKTQTLLERVEHLPEIFHLYANKPVPEEGSSPVKFLKAKPKSINSAVPAELADMALNVAIAQKNLSLVLAIIDNTFCAPAFPRAKIFKKASVPLVGLAAAPAACYALASWAATFQNTMDPSTATGIAFAASLAYVGGTSSLGIMAITTANDQMERVVWLSGIPLRQRWLREEERAAMDRVAVAWGFKDPYMRGEEVGEEWESLREFIGMRGMVLDKTELMEGMQ